jgi:hypothetical protein
MLIFEINNCGHEIKITLQKIKTKSWIKFLTIKKIKKKTNNNQNNKNQI